MKTKTILSIAIMAALPFAAHADPVGPAAVPANGTAVVATANAPYVTQTPTAADATHIASTAYVKGAYNDAIAAVNKVNSDKQDKLVDPDTGNNISTELFSTNLFTDMAAMFGEDLSSDASDVDRELTSYMRSTNINPYTSLINAGGALLGMKLMTHGLTDALNNKRVEIYTTWENDNAKQQVAFVNAQ